MSPHPADPAPATPAPRQRDAAGRYVKGNLGGPGNPFARQVAALRTALLGVVTAERIQNIARALLIKAEGGDVAAARLVLAYTLGKPAAAPDPDRLDLDEWKLLADSVPADADGARIRAGAPVAFCLKVARTLRDTQDATLTRELLEEAGSPEEGRAYEESILGPRVGPSPDGGNGPAATPTPPPRPAPNGTNGTGRGAPPPSAGPPAGAGAPSPNGGHGLPDWILEREDAADWIEAFGDDEGGAPPSPNGRHGGAPPSPNGS